MSVNNFNDRKLVLILSFIIVHLVFCLQLFLAAPKHGLMLPTFAWFLVLHLMTMYYFGRFPMDNGVMDWPAMLWDIVVSIPASVLYALIITGVFLFLRLILVRIWQRL